MPTVNLTFWLAWLRQEGRLLVHQLHTCLPLRQSGVTAAGAGVQCVYIFRGICYKGGMDIRTVTDEILARRHWVFDLDGTLTVAIHDFGHIRATLGVPEGVDILGHLAALPEAEALTASRKLAEIEDELVAMTEPADGAFALVELLHRRGARLGVLTRNTRDNALRTLQRIGLDPFIAEQHVLGRDEAVAKPDPDGILKLAVAWGVDPAGVVMVGDYSFDLMAGRAAGAATVHVDPSGAFRWPDLTDLAVPSLQQLAQAVAAGVGYASVSSS